MGNRTILLVEDNSQDEMLTLRALRKVNLANHVEVVRDGQQALDYLFRQGEFADRVDVGPPTVILLDINLPDGNGLDLIADLRQLGLEIVARFEAVAARDGAGAYAVQARHAEQFGAELLAGQLVVDQIVRERIGGLHPPQGDDADDDDGSGDGGEGADDLGTGLHPG